MATPKLVILSLTAASVLLASAPAMANVKTKEVRYADLDLSSPAGRERLQLRIKQAVKQVCGTPRAFTVKDRQDRSACEKQAYQKAAPESARVIAAFMEKRRLAFDGSSNVAAN